MTKPVTIQTDIAILADLLNTRTDNHLGTYNNSQIATLNLTNDICYQCRVDGFLYIFAFYGSEFRLIINYNFQFSINFCSVSEPNTSLMALQKDFVRAIICAAAADLERPLVMRTV